MTMTDKNALKTYIVSLVIIIVLNSHYSTCIWHRGTAAEYIRRHAAIQLQTTVTAMITNTVLSDRISNKCNDNIWSQTRRYVHRLGSAPRSVIQIKLQIIIFTYNIYCYWLLLICPLPIVHFRRKSKQDLLEVRRPSIHLNNNIKGKSRG